MTLAHSAPGSPSRYTGFARPAIGTYLSLEKTPSNAQRKRKAPSRHAFANGVRVVCGEGHLLVVIDGD